MENEKTQQSNKQIKLRYKMRSITPCLIRKDQQEQEYQIKKQFTMAQQHHQPEQNQYIINQHSIYSKNHSKDHNNNTFHLNPPSFTNLHFLNDSKTNNNNNINNNIPLLQNHHYNNSHHQDYIQQQQLDNIQKMNNNEKDIKTYDIYKDIFNNENSRFRSFAPNHRWTKRLGSIRQKNENSYIINQAQNKKLLANENKDEFILSNYYEQKQQEIQHYNHNNNNNYKGNQQNYNNNNHLQNQSHSHSISPSGQQYLVNDSILQQININKNQIDKQPNQSISNNNSPIQSGQLQDSPEKSIWIPSPKFNKSIHQLNEQSKEELLQQTNLEYIQGGETAHFNNFLQNAVLEHLQNQKRNASLSHEKKSNSNINNKNNLIDYSFIPYNQIQLKQNQQQQYQNFNQQNQIKFINKTPSYPSTKPLIPSTRSVTPSARPFFTNIKVNQNQTIKRERQQFKLNKSNINFFTQKQLPKNQSYNATNIPTPQSQMQRAQTQQGQWIEDENINIIDDENIFIKYNDDSIYKQLQQHQSQQNYHSQQQSQQNYQSQQQQQYQQQFYQTQSGHNLKKIQSKQTMKNMKDYITSIVEPDDILLNQQNNNNINTQNNVSIDQKQNLHQNNNNNNINKNHQNNPSILQYTPKQSMQKYSKVTRFIPIQNRIIRYPAFINIMHNTTRDQTLEILKKNKLLTNEF